VVLLGIGVESFRADAQYQSSPPRGKEPRRVQGEQVMNQLTGGKGLPSHYKQLEKDFPELADMTLKYALGDVWGRKVLSPQTRQLVSLAGFAAQGAMPQFKVHAEYALNLGVKPEELMEVVYITTVTSGYPRALAASSTLKELFTEKKIKLPLGQPRRYGPVSPSRVIEKK
jgi:4-carboxymuconolactone decarboxylase